MSHRRWWECRCTYKTEPFHCPSCGIDAICFTPADLLIADLEIVLEEGDTVLTAEDGEDGEGTRSAVLNIGYPSQGRAHGCYLDLSRVIELREWLDRWIANT